MRIKLYESIASPSKGEVAENCIQCPWAFECCVEGIPAFHGPSNHFATDVKAEIQIPSEAELNAILVEAKGTKYELPIVLAVWLGLWQSEILGLTWDCIDGDTPHIRQAIVMGLDGPMEKGGKTYSETRSLHLPEYLKKLLAAQPHWGDHIAQISGKAIYSGFSRICEKKRGLAE